MYGYFKLKKMQDKIIMEPLLKALKSKSKRKQRKAFDDVYALYSRSILVYCKSLTKNSDEGCDLFQETFIKFYNHIQENKEVRNISSLLFTIAKNLFLNDEKRKNIDRERIKRTQIESNFMVDNDDLDFEEFKNEESIILEKSLNELNENQKKAVILYYYGNLSYNEIAEALGTDKMNVCSYLHRARLKLKESLSKQKIEYNY